ncbi:MAG: hypothetical protein P4N60_10165 [Verrucomicrobiae bacterium]|nr:hypothetical protein [Verrucomicrobiae bacterium]
MKLSLYALALVVLAGVSPAMAGEAAQNAARNSNNPSYGSKIEFIVERYSLDDAARTNYLRWHPPLHTLADLNVKLLNLKSSLGRYKDWVKAADETMRQLAAGVSPSNAAIIDADFAPVEGAVNDNLELVAKLIARYGTAMPAPPIAPEVIAKYHDLKKILAVQDYGDDPDVLAAKISNVLLQLQTSGLDVKVQLKGAAVAIDKLALNRQAVQAALKFVQVSLEPLGKGQADKEQQLKQEAAPAASFAASTQDAVKDAQETGGDLLVRKYTVYQDLSDPFLDYIAQHPERWLAIPNHGLVAGDGDTQFIAVFEDQLDGRFNFVSVDPTKVIQARMRIGRQVAQSLVSLAGVATKAFGVPIPTSLAASQSQSNSETIDYSTMTATQTQMKLQNEKDQKNLEDLKKFAVGALVNFPTDPAKADVIRKDLVRRLQPYLN